MPEIIKLANEFDSVYLELQRAIKENNFHNSIDIMGYLFGLTKAMTIVLDCNMDKYTKEDRKIVDSRISSLNRINNE